MGKIQYCYLGKFYPTNSVELFKAIAPSVALALTGSAHLQFHPSHNALMENYRILERKNKYEQIIPVN